ncbi:CaiB/BaiF CoA transferase family protein [Thermodesulfobacteriota bacterium]
MEEMLPLAGLRVLEFAYFVAGPLTGKLFADFGAEVIVIENEAYLRTHASSRQPGRGATDLTSLNQGNMFNRFGANKLSLSLDMKNPKAIEIIKRFVAVSDIVFDNFTPHVMESWGLTYDELIKVKPDIIVLNMPTMGKGGIYPHHRAESWNILGMAGFNYLSGTEGNMPICPSLLSHPDVSCNPFHAMIAVLSALCCRELTGKGQHIELSQFESTVCFTETGVFDFLVNGQIRERIGNRSNYAAPHGVYRCKGEDQWCAITVFNDDEWKALCRVMDREDLITNENFRTLLQRLKNVEELERILEEWTCKKSPEEVMELLQSVGVAAGKVQNVADLLERDPQLQERGCWIEVEHPETGKSKGEGWGFKLLGSPEPRNRHAPLLGEHTDYVLKKILGMPEEEINQLIIDGVIG